MFIERLTVAQLHNLAHSLTTVFSEIPKEDWQICINQLPHCNSARISIQTAYFSDGDYSMRFTVDDFDIQFWDTGLIDTSFARTQFIQFMYHVFGEEYKEAFIKNALKPFDEIA